MKQERKIPWGPIKVIVINISKRIRVDIHGEKEEYSVIQVVFTDEIDEVEETEGRRKRRRKFLSLMCFIPNIYNNIVERQIFTFRGFISFGYGSTYFCIDKATDALRIPVQSSESIAFAPPDEDFV